MAGRQHESYLIMRDTRYPRHRVAAAVDANRRPLIDRRELALAGLGLMSLLSFALVLGFVVLGVADVIERLPL